MRPGAPITELAWTAHPQEVVLRWPEHEPLAAIWSGADDARSRWTILARPGAPKLFSDGALGALDEALDHRDRVAAHPELPFVGGHFAALGSALGAQIEPSAGPGSPDPWPALTLVPVRDAYVLDRARGTWWAIGHPPALARAPRAGRFTAGGLSAEMDEDAYASRVREALERIGRGDVYQINLTHALSSAFEGSTRALMLALFAHARPWYGAYFEDLPLPTGQRGAIVSASPELLLRVSRTGRATTRPMKGTRPHAGSAEELRASEKERAELNMIVDLMRNDLGRLCQTGSVRVERPRDIEAHAPGPAGVLQATATVSGQLRPGLAPSRIVRAVFPPGSVTGAPKVSAMRVIASLEPRTRGIYCGCCGYFSDCGQIGLNVAIRTAQITGTPGDRPGEIRAGTLRYGVGAGIVAESDPGAEYRETLVKGAVLVQTLSQPADAPTPPPAATGVDARGFSVVQPAPPTGVPS